VIVPGLVERSFPRRARQDPVLLDAERARLNQRLGAARALPLKMASAAAEERLLFRLAIGAARRELILSYPRLTDAGTPQVASSFLLAAERALGAAAVQMPLAPPYPRADDGPPLVPWEFDLREIDAARAERDPRRAAAAAARLGYLYDAYPRFADTVRQHRQRSSAGTWRRLTEFDGMIDRRLAAAFLERRSSGGALRLSPTALERYARCGFQFLQRDVLRLESAPAPERSLDLEPRDLGKLYHALLRDLYLRLQDAGLLPLSAANLAAAQGLVTPTLDALLAARPHLAGEGPEALFAARRRKVAADVEGLLAREASSREDWVPVDFEWSFAPDEPAIVELGGDRMGQMGRLAVRGRIDRLDERGARDERGGRELRIVDYKSGRAEGLGQPGDLKAGRNLQLALYRRAVRARRGDLPVTGALLPLQGDKEPIVWSPEDFAASDAELERLVAEIVGGMAEGAFFQIEQGEPRHYCDELCEFGEICGPGRRSLTERKSHDPEAQRGLRWRGRAGPPPDDEGEEA
jgi:ATP-dependent helicase/nuclease subunit B